MTTIKRYGAAVGSHLPWQKTSSKIPWTVRIELPFRFYHQNFVKISNNRLGNFVEEKERIMSKISPSSSEGSLLPNVLSSVDSAGSSFLNISCNAWNKVSDNKMLRTRSHNFSINNCSNFIVHVNA